MTNDALIARFEDAATRQSATQFLDCIDEPKDMETNNRLVCEVTDIIKELKSRGLLVLLLPYLSSPDMTVRHRAAQGCLRIAERQAVAALEEVAAKGTFDQRIRARDTLDHWRRGKCLIDHCAAFLRMNVPARNGRMRWTSIANGAHFVAKAVASRRLGNPEMAPERLEKIDSTPGNGMAPEPRAPQICYECAASGQTIRLVSRR